MWDLKRYSKLGYGYEYRKISKIEDYLVPFVDDKKSF